MLYRHFFMTAYCSGILIQLHCFSTAPPTLFQQPFRHKHSCDRLIFLNYYPAFQIAHNFCSRFNKEFHNFQSSPNIDSVIKSMRMIWVQLWHQQRRRAKYNFFFSRNVKERDYLYSCRSRGEERTGLIWLRRRISGGLL